MADRISYRLPLHERTEVLRVALEIELRPGIPAGKDIHYPHAGRHKDPFYNMPGLHGQTVPLRGGGSFNLKIVNADLYKY